MPVNDMHVPHFVDRGSGELLQDAFLLLSMAPCLPTIYLAYKQKRTPDMVIYLVSLALAITFHFLQITPEGLSNSFLGVKGSTWRTWDVIVANVVLVRTLGNGIGMWHPAVTVIPNIVVPASLFGTLALYPSVDIVPIVKIAASSISLLLCGKALIERWRGFPAYSRGAKHLMLWSTLAGFVCFGMPHAQPHRYWLWHSLWHMCMAASFFVCYYELPEASQRAAAKEKKQRGAAEAAKWKEGGQGRAVEAQQQHHMIN